MKKLIVILITSLLYISCTDSMRVSGDADRDDTGNVSIRLMIIIPASTTCTRMQGTSATTDHESKTSEIQVLVFGEDKYRYRVPGMPVNNTSSVASFKVLLKSSSSPLKLLVLADATDAVIANEPLVDDSGDLVKKDISLRFSNIASSFPMYGEHKLPGGLKATVINNITRIEMLRSIARVDVKATEVTNFKLSGVKTYHANDHLQIVSDEAGAVRVALPSVPIGNTGNINSVLYSVPTESLNEFSVQLYLPEAGSPTPDNRVSQATCIVMEGYYKGSDQPSYYHMDFDPDNVESAFGQIPRNHKYIFSIRKVSGPGWSSPDEAASNRSAHIIAKVQAWDGYTVDMSFDGEHHSGVPSREIILKDKADSTEIISVNADLPDYTLQWADAPGTPQGTADQSLANEFFKVEKTQNEGQLMITALRNNSASNIHRTQSFVITAHRWCILVNMQQRCSVAAYKMIDLLTFNAGLGYLGTDIIGSGNTEAHVTGLRGILSNQNNFGPVGIVECGGYNLIGVSTSNNNLTNVPFAAFDIVYVHYVSDSLFGIPDAQKMHNRVEAKKSRVLIVSCDAGDVSQNLLREISGGNSDISFIRNSTGAFPLANPVDGSHYFTSTDPSTNGSYTPVSTDFSLRNYDSFHGKILLNTDAPEGITPILTGSSGGIVLGIDYSRKIVYWDDTDIGNSGTGTGGTTNNRINSDDGTINNDASKLIANVFAWITETILYGE